MGLLLMIVLLSAANTLVDSASNKNDTDCDAIRNNSSCTQSPSSSCIKVMHDQITCNMVCGFVTPYDRCDQRCDGSDCDVLECHASERCSQDCRSGKCGSMTCNAKDCTQSCSAPGLCRTLTCPSTVKSCTQLSGREMTCEADVCKQSCYERDCQMICPTRGINCTQVSDDISIASMECDRGLCTQSCYEYGTCNSAVRQV